MSKEEIEANQCDMCSSESHGEAEDGEDSCCSDRSLHVKLETDATTARLPDAPQPLFFAAILTILSEVVSERPALQTADLDLAPQSFPPTQEHTVLRV